MMIQVKQKKTSKKEEGKYNTKKMKKMTKKI